MFHCINKNSMHQIENSMFDHLSMYINNYTQYYPFYVYNFLYELFALGWSFLIQCPFYGVLPINVSKDPI